MDATAQLPLPAAPVGRYAMIAAKVEQRRPQTPDSGDAALAEALRARRPGALEAVYERFGRVTFGFLLKTLRDRQLAEDVQQQVFLEVWQRAPSYDSARGSLMTWMMTIARSRAIDQLRRRVPEPIGVPGEPAIESKAPVEPDAADALVERYRVAALLSRLPSEERRLLQMRFYRELSQTEIAEQTGIPLGTVKMKMVRALERLRELIEEEE